MSLLKNINNTADTYEYYMLSMIIAVNFNFCEKGNRHTTILN